ncbi:CaiB/BaiF CoA transferase family protein [Thermoproteus tenax]|uniref:Citrate lyase alpha subunit (Citrate CoA transferase), acetyl-CoA transferase/carnitine dehydratase n=2 Tax=Thermoproteus tenax TaxID=2271 RepID=G4RKH2_THETK|nr:CaiB/BaiF CoA-transferase family protein [Thermoproteus tenax]CCC82067.1 citrate lyase alpha subunit (citrate CoA transferase), acetyl-CoA transferase/carnitine dehydratase [Thermoproteus tenax Kra 1]
MYRAVELGHVIAGPYAGLVLAHLGFEVIKIEPPSGDPTRYDDVMGDSIFVFLNRNKKSLALDLKKPEGRAIFLEILRSSNVLIENLAPGAMDRLGLDRDTLFKANGELVYCSIKGYPTTGSRGSWPAFGTLIEATSGVMWANGNSRLPASITDMSAGLYCALTVLWALLTKRPGYYEVSLFQTDVAWLGYYLVAYQTLGKIFPGAGDRLPFWAPYELFPTKDGYIYIAVANNNIWSRFCKTLKVSACEDPKFATNEGRVANREELHRIIEEATKGYTTGELLELLLKNDVPAAPLNDIRTLISEGDILWDFIASSDRKIAAPRLPLPGSLNGSRAPAVGENSIEILKSLGVDDKKISELIEKGVIRA